MRFRSLAQLEKPRPREVVFTSLPEAILLTDYARQKAFLINQLVREQHGRSYEWYGFTLGTVAEPELILDIGLPVNEQNLEQYVSLTPEQIAAFRDSLPRHLMINGWIHSHGDLELHRFSDLDAANQVTVLDFVTAQLRCPVAKVQVLIEDLVLLAADSSQDLDLASGSVSLITDVPVRRAELWEMVYGGFCYALVIGDSGWHTQEIYHKKRGILTGSLTITQHSVGITPVDDGRRLTSLEIETLAAEVAAKISPVPYIPPKIENL